MAPERLKVPASRVEWREIEGEIVALDLESSTYLAVTGSAVAVWPLLIEGTDRAAVLRAIVDRFDVDEATAERDLDGFLAELDRQGLLERERAA